MNSNLIYLDTYVLQKDMRIRLPKNIIENLNLIKGESKLKIYYDKNNASLVLKPESKNMQMTLNFTNKTKQNNSLSNKIIKFVDLFAGLGGIRLGFEQAFNEKGFNTKCVLTSEIKPYAIEALQENFKQDNLRGDIYKINTNELDQKLAFGWNDKNKKEFKEEYLPKVIMEAVPNENTIKVLKKIQMK